MFHCGCISGYGWALCYTKHWIHLCFCCCFLSLSVLLLRPCRYPCWILFLQFLYSWCSIILLFREKYWILVLWGDFLISTIICRLFWFMGFSCLKYHSIRWGTVQIAKEQNFLIYQLQVFLLFFFSVLMHGCDYLVCR